MKHKKMFKSNVSLMQVRSFFAESIEPLTDSPTEPLTDSSTEPLTDSPPEAPTQLPLGQYKTLFN